MVAHACNPSIWEAETGGSEFVASLSYLVRPCFKIKRIKPGVVAHACNPSIWEAETGGLRFEETASATY